MTTNRGDSEGAVETAFVKIRADASAGDGSARLSLPSSVAAIRKTVNVEQNAHKHKPEQKVVLPTTDADKVSINLEKLGARAAKIRQALEEAVSGDPNQKKLEEARAKIAQIVEEIVPLSAAERAKFEAASSMRGSWASDT